MSDCLLVKDTNGLYDLDIENGDFVADDGFDTAITISLLTDQRAPDDKIIIPQNRRGWLGDLFSEFENRLIGSLLWLIDQRRLTDDTLNECLDYAKKSLTWITSDGIAKSIQVFGEIVVATGILLNIEITNNIGSTQNYYIELWEDTGA